MNNHVFTLSVTPDEVRVIAAGLAELPFKFAQPLIAKLDQQLIAQQPKQEEKKDG